MDQSNNSFAGATGQSVNNDSMMMIMQSEAVVPAKYIHFHVEDVSFLLRRKLKMIMSIGLLNKKKKWRVLGGVCR